MKIKRLLFFVVLVFIMCLPFYKVSAEEVITSDEISIVGAQVRTIDNAGIRFVGSVENYDTINVSKYGMILAYGETEEEFYLDSIVNGKEVVSCEVSSTNEDGNYFITLYNIPEVEYSRKISARAYVIDNEGNIIYGSTSIARSLDEVVFEAYVNGDRSEFVSKVYKVIEEATEADLVYDGSTIVDYNGSREILAIPEGPTSIGEYAFEYCTSLVYLNIPKGLKKIEEGTFRACFSITEITIPSSVRSVERCAFSTCQNLEKVTLNKGLISIGEGAFEFCSSLTEIVIPEGVTSIGEGAFFECSSLKNVVILKGIKSISNYTFQYCYSLVEITIPSTVKIFEFASFYGCDSLTKIYYKGTIDEWNNITFDDNVMDYAQTLYVLNNNNQYYDATHLLK